jgi:AcrR family transcriptional regulator
MLRYELVAVKIFYYYQLMAKLPYHHGDLKNALIQAGIDILSAEGLAALSLRRVASRAGVSHSAPYAHFTDKQALIAAISTEGFRRLYDRIDGAMEGYREDPRRRLMEASWAYLQFALESPALFKIMFSGIVENEKAYPLFVDYPRRSFGLLAGLVGDCQDAGLLGPGPADLAALGLWSLIHGFADLLLERQIPRSILDQAPLRALLLETLAQHIPGLGGDAGPRPALTRGPEESER